MSLEIIKLEKNDCPSCKILGMILEHEVNYPITVINLDETKEASTKYNTMAVPVLIFEKDGVEIERLTEGRDFSGEKINELIEQYRDGSRASFV